MAKKNWREDRKKVIRILYGGCYTKYNQEEYHDDRRLYCNIIRQIMEALNTLPENPNNYVCVAMNRLIDEDLTICRRIIKRFEGEFPQWSDEYREEHGEE